ncbi:MAG TPA: hypothetical protein VJ302_05050 [Blastocatellia bacterium]|nr:hypothetical protein [Blastocatellia bacterium]
MNMLSIGEVGNLIIYTVNSLQGFVQIVIGITIGLVTAFLLLRILTDVLKLNPFGRLYQNARRPTDEVIARMKSSRFYYPLRKSLGFDPAVIMVLFALAITWYVVYTVIDNLFLILNYLGASIIRFGNGNFFIGALYLIGTLLLAIILFLMTLMTIVFVNWLFGLLRGASYWAMERLSPLLHVFEFGGMFAGFSFIILWIALTFAYAAVLKIFF